MANETASRVQRISLKSLYKKAGQNPDTLDQKNLISYIPHKSEPSQFLNDYQIGNIIPELPALIRARPWNLVYSLNRDGVSMSTFMENTKRSPMTLLFIQDSKGYVFGAFCTANWHISSSFFGDGESFVFTFKDGDRPSMFYWTGESDQFQWSDG